MKIFITGGAGYIGSHVSLQLLNAGHEITIYDDLSLSSLKNIDKRAKFIKGSTLDISLLEKSLLDDIDLVIHLAGYKAARESMETPSKYSNNNINGSINLLNAMGKHSIKKLIFSSTAAVYGSPSYLPIDENHSLDPINFYGYTKLAIEDFIKWYGKLEKINYVIFRFFNAAGYDTNGRVKFVEQNPTNLLPIIMETANKTRKKMEVYGNTYDTHDGTGVRDYIHVSDLALAHEKAIDYLSKNNSDLITNLATGKGYSVLEIINRFEDLISIKINYDIVNKREGDLATMVALSKIAYDKLDWEPRFSDIDTILNSMWNIYKEF